METPKDKFGQVTNKIMHGLWIYNPNRIIPMGLQGNDYNKVFSHIYEILKKEFENEKNKKDI